MIRSIITAIVTLFASIGFAHALPSDLVEAARAAPTLKGWMAKERMRLGVTNVGYKMAGPGALCTEMNAVGLGCSYNERGDLVGFLYANGVNLFPCKGGSNPYTKGSCDEPNVDFFNYIGRAGQNATLLASIRKNRHLFKGGDLTAANAKKWQD